MIFKSYTFTWWQIGIFKLALLAIGAAIGAHWYEFFGASLTTLIIIAVIAGFYIAFICLKQMNDAGRQGMNINNVSLEELDKLWKEKSRNKRR